MLCQYARFCALGAVVIVGLAAVPCVKAGFQGQFVEVMIDGKVALTGLIPEPDETSPEKLWQQIGAAILRPNEYGYRAIQQGMPPRITGDIHIRVEGAGLVRVRQLIVEERGTCGPPVYGITEASAQPLAALGARAAARKAERVSR